MILQFLQGPICVNRAIKSSSDTDGSRLPIYLLYRTQTIMINNNFKNESYLQCSSICISIIKCRIHYLLIVSNKNLFFKNCNLKVVTYRWKDYHYTSIYNNSLICVIVLVYRPYSYWQHFL
jgi:hypothetical protein